MKLKNIDQKTFINTMSNLIENNINTRQKIEKLTDNQINNLPHVGVKKLKDILKIKELNKEKDVFEYFNLLQITPESHLSLFNKLGIDSTNILKKKVHEVFLNDEETRSRINAFLKFKNKVLRYHFNNTLSDEVTQPKDEITTILLNCILHKVRPFFNDDTLYNFTLDLKQMIEDIKFDRVDIEQYNDEIVNTIDYEFLLQSKYKISAKEIVYQVLKDEKKEISRFNLKNKINKIEFLNIHSLNPILLQLAQDDFIQFTSHGIRAKSPRIDNYIENYKEDRYPHLYMRLKGLTLEEIGKEKGLTRERIRQISAREMKEFPIDLMYESRYRDYFCSLDLNEKEFKHIFKFNDVQYNFLRLFFDKNENRIDKEQLFDNDWLDNMEQARLLELINKGYLIIDNYRIKRNKIDLVKYFLKSLEIKNIALNELHNKIIEFCKERNIDEEFDFSDLRAFEGIVSRLDNVLWKQRKIIRYFPIEQEEVINVLESIEFDRYLNQEISSLIILNDYKELFEEIEIEDEYELHNLLKKYEKYIPEYVFLKRMPTIEIGEINREEQILNFLIEHSPIDKDLFAEKYSEKFGFLVRTIKANHLRFVTEYEEDGMLDADTPPISKQVLSRLSEILTGDFYFKEDILKIYIKKYGTVEHKDYMFEKIGYKNYAQFILSDKYLRADDYFEKYYFNHNIFKLNDNRIKYLGSFRNRMLEMMRNFDLFEFEKNEFINFRLISEKSDVKKDDIKNLIDNILKNVDDKYFTVDMIDSIINQSNISELGFDDIFYESLLKGVQGLRYHIIGGKHVFKKTQEKFYTDTLIEHLLTKFSDIDIYELQQYLEEKYGINITVSKLIETTKDTEMYYHPIMERLYRDIELFYEYMEEN